LFDRSTTRCFFDLKSISKVIYLKTQTTAATTTMFSSFLSPQMVQRILAQPNALKVSQVANLTVICDENNVLDESESPEALQFVVDVFNDVEKQLNDVLQRRVDDRAWIDAQSAQLARENALFERKPNGNTMLCMTFSCF
jgi:hypothetical protein